MNPHDLLDFFDAPITIGWSLTPTSALEFLKAKGLKIGFSYADLAAAEHASAFTVAKMMDTDMLADVKASLEEALATGRPFREWADEIIPTLQAKGWWGRQAVVDPLSGQTVVAQLGSPGRLQTIFRTNMQSAYAVGEWEQIQDQAEQAPFLMYDAIDDHRTRQEHAAWDGKVFPVSHPFWKDHHPPNGWNCRCSVIQLSQDDLDELGLNVSQTAPTGTYNWTNPRTGKVEQIPNGIDPGFNHNPGQARLDQLAKLAAEKAKALPADAAQAALQGLQATQAAMDVATAAVARQVLDQAAKRGGDLAAAGKAAERAAASQIQKALTEKTPYLSKAITEVQKTKGAQGMTSTELLAVAKEKAAKAEASAALAHYKQAKLAGKAPGTKAQAAFDALPDEAQGAITAQLDAQVAEIKLQATAKAELAELTSNPNSVAAKALAKIDQEGKPPVAVLAELKAAVEAAKTKQATAQGLAGYQKSVLAGKPPTPAQKAAFDAVGPDQQAAVLKAIDKAKADELAKAPPPAAVPETGPAQTSATAFNVDDLVQIGPQKGSNPGGLYQDTRTGTQWYIKRPGNPEQARNEVLAGKLYELAGIEVPDLRLVTIDGQPAIASKIIDGLTKGKPAQLAKAGDGFAVDAWLGNWDVVGQGYDNLLMRAGVPVRVDTGGALRFRAQGGLKGSAWGDEVLEIDTLRNAGTNPQSAEVFGKISQAQIEASVAKVLSIPEPDIRRLVDEFGPLDAIEREKLARTLLARQADLGKRYPNARPAVAPVADLPSGRVTALEQRQIEASRANGYTVLTDADAIEDHHVVVSTYTDAAGKARTRVVLKLRPEAAAKIEKEMGGAGAPPEIDLSEVREKWKAAVKSINLRVASGKTTADATVASKVAAAKAATQSLLDKIFDQQMVRTIDRAASIQATKALEDFYQTMRLLNPEDAIAGKVPMKAIPMIDFETSLPNVKLPVPEGGNGRPWQRKTELKYGTTKIIKGAKRETGQTEVVRGIVDVRTLDLDGGGSISYVTNSRANRLTLQGQLQLDLDGVDAATTARAFDELERLGIPVARATAEARLELYVDRHLYIRSIRNPQLAADIKALAAVTDQGERIAKKTALLNKAAGFDVTTSRNWDPQGRHQAFGHGRVLTYRADLPDAEVQKFQREYVLYHNPSGYHWGEGGRSVIDKFKLMVENGGQLASLADRIRRGVGISGSSPDDDLVSGGGNYVFARLSKRKKGHASETRSTGFYFKPEAALRTDAFSYDGDVFGNVDRSLQEQRRAIDIDGMRRNAERWMNETNLRDSVSLFDSIEHIVLESQRDVADAIAFMRAQGYNEWPDGRPLAEVILPRDKFPYP